MSPVKIMVHASTNDNGDITKVRVEDFKDRIEATEAQQSAKINVHVQYFSEGLDVITDLPKKKSRKRPREESSNQDGDLGAPSKIQCQSNSPTNQNEVEKEEQELDLFLNDSSTDDDPKEVTAVDDVKKFSEALQTLQTEKEPFCDSGRASAASGEILEFEQDHESLELSDAPIGADVFVADIINRLLARVVTKTSEKRRLMKRTVPVIFTAKNFKLSKTGQKNFIMKRNFTWSYCFMCKREIKTELGRMQHVLQKHPRWIITEPDDFKCPRCEWVTDVTEDFVVHRCSKADLTKLRAKTKLKSKMMKPSDPKAPSPQTISELKYKCASCSNAFKESAELMDHMKTGSCPRLDHQMDKKTTFRCDLDKCDYVCHTRISLCYHKLQAHKDVYSIHQCPCCPWTFDIKDDLEYHFQKTHSVIGFAHTCPFCPQSFASDNLGTCRSHFSPLWTSAFLGEFGCH